MQKYAKFEEVYRKAFVAGMGAGHAAAPTPMVVGSPSTPFGNDVDYSKKTYYVPDGVCGFAWVTVRPGTSAFAKWLAKTGKARKAYEGGMQIWVSQFGQSMQRKEAFAAAMAETLRSELGVNAYAGSRMD